MSTATLTEELLSPSEVKALMATANFATLASPTSPTSPTSPARSVPGRVTLRTEWEGVWEGSLLTNLRDLGDKWLCDWPTSGGTVSDIEVPKDRFTEPEGGPQQ